MIASKDTLEPKSSDYVMPNSQRVYVEGEIHPEVRVPFREISLAPTKDFSGQLEPNEPVRVYDAAVRGAIRNSLATQAKAFRPCARNGSAGEGTWPSTKAARSNPKTTATSRVATKNSPARPSAGIASIISKARNANHSAPAPAIPSRNSGMPARASSRRRWSSSRSAKISDAKG